MLCKIHHKDVTCDKFLAEFLASNVGPPKNCSYEPTATETKSSVFVFFVIGQVWNIDKSVQNTHMIKLHIWIFQSQIHHEAVLLYAKNPGRDLHLFLQLDSEFLHKYILKLIS